MDTGVVSPYDVSSLSSIGERQFVSCGFVLDIPDAVRRLGYQRQQAESAIRDLLQSTRCKRDGRMCQATGISECSNRTAGQETKTEGAVSRVFLSARSRSICRSLSTTALPVPSSSRGGRDNNPDSRPRSLLPFFRPRAAMNHDHEVNPWDLN